MKKLDADLKHEICRWAAHYVSKQTGNDLLSHHFNLQGYNMLVLPSSF